AGQVLLDPVQVSAGSQTPVEARQTVPALPAACWQMMLVPLQRSVVQTLPSSVQAVPLTLKTSAGPTELVPVQVSAASHRCAAAPWSHDSPGSTKPSPHTPALKVAMAAAQL